MKDENTTAKLIAKGRSSKTSRRVALQFSKISLLLLLLFTGSEALAASPIEVANFGSNPGNLPGRQKRGTKRQMPGGRGTLTGPGHHSLPMG
jgi:hypothetical protein